MERIGFFNTQNGNFLNSTCSNDYYGISNHRSQNFTISENFLNNISGIAMFLMDVNNIVISRNIISDVYRGIDLEDVENIIISENTINTFKHAYSKGIEVFGSGINYSFLNNIIEYGVITIPPVASVFGNQIFGSGFRFGPYSNIEFDSSNLVNDKPVYFYENKTGLRPNDFVNAGQVFLSNCNDSIISNLEISHTYRALYLYRSHNNTISYNNFSYNQERGLVASGLNHIIKSNIISDNYVAGLSLAGFDSIISDNIMVDNRYNIEFDFSNNFIISNNTISGGTIFGVYLRYSNNHTFLNNRVIKNRYGLFWSGKNNTISSNLIKDNYECGINIWDNGNLIYYNCFINNSLHAHDDGNNNSWDNGIGDIPYNISGSAKSKDNFPLMNCPLLIEDEPQEISGYNIIFIIIIINFMSLIIIIKSKSSLLKKLNNTNSHI